MLLLGFDGAGVTLSKRLPPEGACVPGAELLEEAGWPNRPEELVFVLRDPKRFGLGFADCPNKVDILAKTRKVRNHEKADRDLAMASEIRLASGHAVFRRC